LALGDTIYYQDNIVNEYRTNKNLKSVVAWEKKKRVSKEAQPESRTASKLIWICFRKERNFIAKKLYA
jgi:hypothetical protein